MQCVHLRLFAMENVGSCDGTISARDFHASAIAFAARWQNLNSESPPWIWVSSARQRRTPDQLNGYLVLEKLCLPYCNQQQDLVSQEGPDNEEEADEEDEPVDDAMMVERNQGITAHYYDFHALYSTSFRVPVLFFRAYRPDGEPLVMDEIERNLPASSTKTLLESKWTFITQEEHPHLQRPWFKLHPCGTSEWMKLLFEGNAVQVNLYLASWLSVVGQVVGLRIPPEIIKPEFMVSK